MPAQPAIHGRLPLKPPPSVTCGSAEAKRPHTSITAANFFRVEISKAALGNPLFPLDKSGARCRGRASFAQTGAEV
jgi:hypothetical protein